MAVVLLVLAAAIVWFVIGPMIGFVPGQYGPDFGDLLFFYLSLAIVMAFCILFAVKAFRGSRISSLAMVTAFLLVSFVLVLTAGAFVVLGGDMTGFTLVLAFMLVMAVFPIAAGLAAVVAAAGIVALLLPSRKNG